MKSSAGRHSARDAGQRATEAPHDQTVNPLWLAAPFFAAWAWGGAFTAARVLVAEIHPLVATAARFVGAAILVVAWARFRRGPLSPVVSRGDWLILVAIAATETVLPSGLYFYGLTFSTAVNLSLINAAQPPLTAFFAAWLLRETITTRQTLGVLISVLGVVYIIVGGSLDRLVRFQVNPGDLLFVVSVACYGLASVFIRVAAKRMDTLTIVTYQSVIGAVLIVGIALPFLTIEPWSHLSPAGWGALIYLSAIGTVLGLALWTEGIQRVGVNRAAAFGNVIPLAGAAVAWLVLAEPLGVHHLVGGALVFLGVYLTAVRTATRPSVDRTPPQ